MHVQSAQSLKTMISMVGMVLIIVGGFSYLRFTDFTHNAAGIAGQSARSASSQISFRVNDLRRRISLFTNERKDALQRLAKFPSDQQALKRISDQLATHFPDYFALTITNDQGDALFEGLDSLVGSKCRNDIRSFVGQTDKHDVYVHPSPNKLPYHFDIMVPFEYETGKIGIFFVSFFASSIADILRSTEVRDHDLLLLLEPNSGEHIVNALPDDMGKAASPDYKIEITASGARDILARKPYLSRTEWGQVLTVNTVSSTRWHLIGLPSKELITSAVSGIVTEGLLVAAVLLLMSFVLLRQASKVKFAVQEISRRRRAEIALRESQERFKNFAEAASDWFWEMDKNLKFTYFSERYEEICKIDRYDKIGSSRIECVPSIELESNPEKWAAHLADLGARRSFSNFEYLAQQNSSGGRHVMISGKPFFDASDNFAGYRGTGTDISERRLLENQLRQSQKMDVVGQLTGGVAHDFNNLLSVMMGNTELLGDRIGDDNKAGHCIEALKRAIGRAASLTSRLLAFARQENLSPVSTNIDDLVTGLEDMLDRTLGETVELTVTAATDLWPALIDPHQFENALVNLAINGRDAMIKGGILTIQTANVTLDQAFVRQFDDVTAGDYVMVTVTDTGRGMSPGVLDKVFEPFFTTKDVGAGSGLGLSMVYGFAKQSNGHIALKSEADIGTAVSLYLPRYAGTTTGNLGRKKLHDFAPRSECILLVEDEKFVREYSAAILRDQGYTVVEAENGDEAIARLKGENLFDLLFTDVVLPGGMNGIEIADEALRIQPEIKILYTTGYSENTVAHGGKLTPGKTLINKPYDRSELLTKIRTRLDKQENFTI